MTIKPRVTMEAEVVIREGLEEEKLWRCYCIGDKDSEDMPDVIIAAKAFPEGTRIEIAEPSCSECHLTIDNCTCRSPKEQR